MRGHLNLDQSRRNAYEAIRCLELVSRSKYQTEINLIAGGEYEIAIAILSCQPIPASNLVPNPIVVAIAETRNAIRYRE